MKKDKVLDRTKYGHVLSENSKGQNGTIYLNGIKIAYENTFRYSYNIKIEEDKLKKGVILVETFKVPDIVIMY